MTTMPLTRMPRLCILISLALLALVPMAAAKTDSDNDRVQFAKSIVVEPGEEAGDLVCIACSIRILGHTGGDVVAIAGSVSVGEGAAIAGDTVAVAGSIRLDAGSQVGGDVVTVGGALRRDPTARIGGKVSTRAGGGWFLLIFVIPLLMLGAFIALIIWLIQRSRQPPVSPGYPAPPSVAS